MAIIRSVTIDHATLQRWVIRFVKLIDKEVRRDARAAKAFFRKVNIMVSLKSNSCALNSLNKSLAKVRISKSRFVKSNILIILLSKIIVLLKKEPGQCLVLKALTLPRLQLQALKILG